MPDFGSDFGPDFDIGSDDGLNTSPLPFVTVEVGFGQSLATGLDDIDWTDVTERVRTVEPVTFNRGRAEAGADQPTAGTGSLAFDNSDAALTPGRSDGPFGAVTTRVPVRVRGDAGVGARPLWCGFVSDWTWEHQPPVTHAKAQASDVVAAAARIELAPWLTGRVRRLEPDYWWPLTDPAGSVQAANGVHGPPLTLTGAGGDATFGIPSDLTGDETDTVLALTPGTEANQGRMLEAPIRLTGTFDFAVSVWIRPAAGAGDNAVVTVAADPMTADTDFWLDLREDGRLIAREGEDQFCLFAGQLAAGRWHHVYWEHDHSVSTETGTWGDRHRVWVDGAACAVDYADGFGSDFPMNTRRVLRVAGPSQEFPSLLWDGQIAQVAVWTDRDSTRVAALADRGAAGATAASRFGSLAALTTRPDQVGSWLTADPDADTAMSQMPVGGVTLLEAASRIARTENGQVFTTADGRLRLASSSAMVATTPVLCLSAQSDVLNVGDAFTLDDLDAVEKAEVTNQPSGQVSTYTRSVDPDNITGGETVTAEVWAVDQIQAQSVALRLANRDTTVPRAPQLQVSMDRAVAAGVADAVLALDLGDLIEVTDLPATAPATTLRLVVAAIAHANVGQPGWTVTVDTEPGAAAVGWLLGDDVLSQLGDTTVLL